MPMAVRRQDAFPMPANGNGDEGPQPPSELFRVEGVSGLGLRV